jgi:hypothetical protein
LHQFAKFLLEPDHDKLFAALFVMERFKGYHGILDKMVKKVFNELCKLQITILPIMG